MEYLNARSSERLGSPGFYMEQNMVVELGILKEVGSAVEAAKADVSTKLFVRNIPYACSDDTIRDAFKKVGIEVEEVIVPKDGDRNRGFAFVEVMDHETAMNAP